MKNREKRAIVIGIMSEICMKAKILRDKLKKNPDLVEELLESLESLEEEMVVCVNKFNSFSS